MTDPRLTTLAEILVKKSIAVQPMEKVWIRAYGIDGLPLVTEVYKQVVLAGALPGLDISSEGLSSWYLTHANKEQLSVAPTVFEMQAKYYDKSIAILAERTASDLSLVPVEVLREREKLHRPISQIIMSKPWVLTYFPTAAMAQTAGMNLEALEDFYFSSTNQDWLKIEKTMSSIAKKLTDAEIHVVGEETDLRLSTVGRTWIADDWKANMPGGEVFTSPVDDSVEGHVYFNYPLQRQGRMMRDIRLWFKKGKIVKATASENQEMLEHIIATDEGSYRLGEFAIGGNPGISQYMNNVLFDEKMLGTLHMAIGQSFEDCKGINASAVHMDIIKNMRVKGSYITANDVVILQDGVLLNV